MAAYIIFDVEVTDPTAADDCDRARLAMDWWSRFVMGPFPVSVSRGVYSSEGNGVMETLRCEPAAPLVVSWVP